MSEPTRATDELQVRERAVKRLKVRIRREIDRMQR
jgi:hypothetical protein